MANTYLKRTNGSPTNAGKGTFSVWLKRSSVNTSNRILMNFYGGNDYAYIRFHSDGYLEMYEVNNGSMRSHYKTNRLFKDTNAWYHLQFVIDTSESTSTDRFKIYVNGQLETSYNTQTFGASSGFNLLSASGTNYHTVGSAENGSESFNGLMSHVHFCDGTALAPTVFGETDSTTGEWKIKTNVSFTPGNNGYTILKDGNTITDQSANSNDFTLGAGTLTQTVDSPSNVFATGNPLIGVHSNGNTLVPTFSNGNNTATATGSAWRIFKSTLGASSGKYYAEFKWISDSNTRYAYVGIYDEDEYANKISGYPYMGDMANGHSYGSQDGDYYTNAGQTSFGSVFSNGSIIGVAMDLDNSKVYFSKDGTWQGSGNPTNGTYGKSITANRTYTFGVQIYSVGSIVYSANFGNGYFGTTAVATNSGNGYAGADGKSIFNYQPPTGYSALSTLGLNQ